MEPSSSRKTWPNLAFTFCRRYGGWLLIALAVGMGWRSLSEFHHPAFGFTRLLQISPSWGQKGLPELRGDSIYIYRDEAGYDGQFYAQLALRPTLRDPALTTAIDIPSMRARRIFAPWVAAVIGLGDGPRTLAAYAWLNVICWLVFGVVLLRLFPPNSWHHLVAWLGLIFSAGVTTSVVYALTDLPALLLLTFGMAVLARGYFKSTAGLFAVACLTRETSVLAGLVFFQSPTWKQRMLCGAIIVVPLALWFLYVGSVFEANPNSLQNFALPFTALFEKLRLTITALWARPRDGLAWASVGAMVGILVQAGWLVLRPQPRNPWWQMGIGYVALLAILGPPTLAGFPGAAPRLLLPLHLAFNVLVPRNRAGLLLLIFGNLSIITGGYMLAQGPSDTRELNHTHSANGPVIVQVDAGWNGVERNKRHTWSWSGKEGRLLVRRFTDDPEPAPVSIAFNLVGELGSRVAITQHDQTLWQGFAEKTGTMVTLPAIELDASGRAWLDFSTTGPVPIEEGTGRHLAFAVYDLEFTEAP